MSQNSIITTIVIILALAVGVFFYYTGRQDVPVYDDFAKETSTEKPTRDAEPIKESPVPLPVMTEEVSEEPLTSAGTSDVDAELEEETEEEPVVPVVTKNTYQITISGVSNDVSFTSEAASFVIVAKDDVGGSESFSQSRLENGTYTIETEKVFVSFSIAVDGYAPAQKSNVILVDHTALVSIEMQAYSVLSGSVKSFVGNVVSNATIVIESGNFKKILHTNNAGVFQLDEMVLAGQYSIAVSHPRFDAKKLVVDLGKGENKTVTITLERDAIFEGTVVTFADKPAADISGVLRHASDASKNRAITTDSAGKFQLFGIAEGKYTLEFNSTIGSLVEPLTFVRNVEFSRSLKLLPPPSIAGVVVDVETKKPVNNLKLFTYDDKSLIEDTTKADGKFSLALAQKGEYRLLTDSDEYELLNSIQKHEPSLEKIVVQVKKKAFLRGKVLASSGYTLTKDFTLTLYNKTKNTETSILSFSVRDGKVLIPLAYFKYISSTDEIQIVAQSERFGKGGSLIMKAKDIESGNDFIVTLGE